VIAAFTSGTISRESPVRVAFHEALAKPEQVGATVQPSPFRFEPEIAVSAVWAAPDRIEFRPKERLPDGQAYAATLDLRPLFPAGKTTLPRFEFVFATMRQSFDVSVFGLEATDAADVKRQTLTGRLLTADVEDAPGVERLLSVTHGGRALAVTWTHDPDRRAHAWRAAGIERGETASVARVSWDGGSIGVDKKDACEVSVPGLDTFTVGEARAVATPEPHVELRFTDPLKAGQNLKGLVRIADRDDLRFVVDGSRVEIYGAKGWRGQQTVRVGDRRQERARLPHEGGEGAGGAVRAAEAGGSLRLATRGQHRLRSARALGRPGTRGVRGRPPRSAGARVLAPRRRIPGRDDGAAPDGAPAAPGQPSPGARRRARRDRGAALHGRGENQRQFC
jgi:hypothetical protein